jgi:hypothetical protein
MKESTWILYSFDVKIDGKNACRLTDKKFQNHENTVDLAGALLTPTTVVEDPEGRCPTCKMSSGETQRDKTQSYEDFFTPQERQEFDEIAKKSPDLAALLPPKTARYRFVSSAKPARERWEKHKKKEGLKGEYAHPIPLKYGGCPIHQEVLRKTDDPVDRKKVDDVDDEVKKVMEKVNARLG